MDNTYWDEVKCTDTKLPPAWSELVWFAGVIAPLQWEACRHRWEFLCRRPCLHPANRHYLNEEPTVYNCVLMNIFVSYGCLRKAEICSKLWGDWDLKHWIRSFPITARNGKRRERLELIELFSRSSSSVLSWTHQGCHFITQPGPRRIF